MTKPDNNVLLPLALPTQSSLRGAVAKIIAAVAALNALIVRAERIAA